MTSTRTTSGRVARVTLVLAALASLVSSVSVAQASPQRGSDSPTSQWLKAPGLRWQAIARVHQLRDDAAGFARTPLPQYYGSQAPYASTPRTQPLPAYYGSTAPYRPTITRTQPLPAYYGTTAPYASEASLPSAQGLRADGLRWQGLARVYEQTHVRARAASTSTSNGFAWGDAGIGLAAGIGAMLLAGAAAIALRKQGRLATQ